METLFTILKWIGIEIITPMFAAAGGALGAFWLEKSRVKSKQRQKNISSLRRTLFYLSIQYQSAHFIYQEYAKLKEDSGRALKMLLLKRGGEPFITDLHTLNFMLNDFSKKNKNDRCIESYKILSAILWAQETYLQFESAIENRNALLIRIFENPSEKDFTESKKNQIYLSLLNDYTLNVINYAEKTLRVTKNAFNLTNSYLHLNFSEIQAPEITFSLRAES